MNNSQEPSTNEKHHIERRQFMLGGTLAVAALGAVGPAAAASQMDHSAHQGHGAYHAPSSPLQALIDSAFDCQQTGLICTEHCIQLLKGGNNALAECLDKVQEMLAICDAMGRLASYGSAHTRKIVQICMDICIECEKECRKHAKLHTPCRACADACAECVKLAKAYLT